jgi:hypothetical protein
MRLKPRLGLALAVFSVYATCVSFAQVAAPAEHTGLPIGVGAGFSGYDPAWNTGHLLGGTIWTELLPSAFHGFGIEAEARDLNYGRSSSAPANLREDSAQGGVIYSWPAFRKFRPYGKYLIGYGNRDSAAINPSTKLLDRYHDSRIITVVGGGVDYRLTGALWVRGDYEYQSWRDLVYKPIGVPIGPIHPQGFTVGFVCHFGNNSFRR